MELVLCEPGASVDIIRTRFVVGSVASDVLSKSGSRDHVDQDAPQDGPERSGLVAAVLRWI